MRLTFRELVNRKEENLVRVICNKGVSVEIGKGMFGERGKKVVRKERVVVGGRAMMTLKDCFNAYITVGGK